MRGSCTGGVEQRCKVDEDEHGVLTLSLIITLPLTGEALLSVCGGSGFLGDEANRLGADFVMFVE